ncbi:MAG: winged helix-turn-helix transcriptional regulator [Nitrososphaeria archaeon]|nr:winged helix-turn-helix transcriptional regulator [Nitrososphaeria archaeon]
MSSSRNQMNELNRARVRIFRALADPIRLEILQLLSNGEVCVCEIFSKLNVPQPLVSRHLKILKECGLVRVRKERNRRYYSVTDKRVYEVIEMVSKDFVDSIKTYLMAF